MIKLNDFTIDKQDEVALIFSWNIMPVGKLEYHASHNLGGANMLLRVLKVVTDELMKALVSDQKAPETNESSQESVISANPFTPGNRIVNFGNTVDGGSVSLFKQKISSYNETNNENETWAPEYRPVNPFRKHRLNIETPENAQQ